MGSAKWLSLSCEPNVLVKSGIEGALSPEAELIVKSCKKG